jgi:hypothetical protein
MSIRNVSSPDVVVTLADDSTVRFSRVRGKRWAELSEEIRSIRIKEELKLIGGEKDPDVRQRLRLRAMQFEPSLRSLIAYCESPGGINALLSFAGRKAGETEERVREMQDIIAPTELFGLLDEIIHVPSVKIDPKDSGPIDTDNPTFAGGSFETTGEGSKNDGSTNQNPSTGSISPDDFGPSTDSTPTT